MEESIMTKPIYQKYNITTHSTNKDTLYYLSHETPILIEENSNLFPAIHYTTSLEKNRIILIVPSTSIGYQAASILSSRLAGYHKERNEEEDNSIPEDEFDLDDLDEDEELPLSDFILSTLNISIDKNAINPSLSISPYDFRILKQTPFDQVKPESETISPQIIMPIPDALPIISDKNVLIFCSAQAQSALRMEEFLNNMMDKNLILLIKEEEANSDFIENLSFKYQFDILKFKKPSLIQETNIFIKLLKERKCRVASSVNLMNIVQSLIVYRDYHYEEADLERFVAQLPTNHLLQEKDFSFYYYKKHCSGLEDLKNLIGQEKVKQTISRIVIAHLIDAKRQQEQNIELPKFHMHFAFSGEPGTGKTETARILSRILHENGLRNGKFIEAGRENLVGKYLGQTSPLIASLFERAKGGVIFIDEVASLIINDFYAQEAVSALVRHMEGNPDTTIIFATYPNQMKAFLNLNFGLTSRISKNIQFHSYTNNELWEIFQLFAKKSGFEVQPECKKYVTAFIDETRKEKRENFGNARVMRTLFQEAKECSSLRIYNNATKHPSYCITTADVKKATKYQSPNSNQNLMIGFTSNQIIK